MSGIACIFHADGRPVDRAVLESVVAPLALRGVDVDGAWLADAIALATAVHGICVSGDLVVAADARIDNREELVGMLGLPITEREITDAELILRAYHRWGEECPGRLVGDFSFIIHDCARRTIFCARDPIGVLPFYYHRQGGLFVAASELKGLLAHPDIPHAVDEQRIGDYLSSLFDDREITFYSAARRLAPGHTMAVGADGIRISRYAMLDPRRELKLASAEEYAAAFRDLFTETVRCRVPAGGKVGAALSGGLDSSSVAIVAAQVLAAAGRGPLHTFSAVYSRPEADERRYMEVVAARGGMTPHSIAADELDPLADAEQRRARLDEPYFSPNFYIHWHLFREASACGAGVWLDGLDGDTTVSHGTGFLIELARAGRWLRLGGEIGTMASRTGASRLGLLRRGVVNPLVLGPLRRVWHRVNGRALRPWGERSIIREDFARRVDLADRINGSIGARPAAGTLREDHHRRIEWGLHTFILEMLDKAAATFRIVPRYPFYDRRLIEFCLALPPEQKLGDGWGRAVLRRAMEGMLPDEVRLRTTKGDPGKSFFNALNRHAGPRMRDLLAGDSAGLGRYVDLARLRAIHRKFVRSEATGEEIMELWKGVTLGIWLEGREGAHRRPQG